jgi:hypothetical protein
MALAALIISFGALILSGLSAFHPWRMSVYTRKLAVHTAELPTSRRNAATKRTPTLTVTPADERPDSPNPHLCPANLTNTAGFDCFH